MIVTDEAYLAQLQTMLKEHAVSGPLLDVAVVDLDDDSELFVRSVLQVFAEYSECGLNYRGRLAGESVTQSLGKVVGDLFFVDVDSDSGRSAWYTLRALYGDAAVVVIATDPNAVTAANVFAKPLRAKPLLNFIKRVAVTS